MSALFFGFLSNDCLEIDCSEISICGTAMGMLLCMSLYSVWRNWLLLLFSGQSCFLLSKSHTGRQNWRFFSSCLSCKSSGWHREGLGHWKAVWELVLSSQIGLTRLYLSPLTFITPPPKPHSQASLSSDHISQWGFCPRCDRYWLWAPSLGAKCTANLAGSLPPAGQWCFLGPLLPVSWLMPRQTLCPSVSRSRLGLRPPFLEISAWSKHQMSKYSYDKDPTAKSQLRTHPK